MSSTIHHTDEHYVEVNIRLEESTWAKIEPLAKASGLSVEQMTQAIITLQMAAGGWLHPEANTKVTPEAEDPCGLL